MPDDPGGTGSMNDLSFLLIIFFIVIASFSINKGFVLNLPDKTAPVTVLTDELMRCTLKVDGTLQIAEETLTLAELESKIKAKQAKYPNMTFLLEIEAETEYQKVVDVINEIRDMEVENFSFKMIDGGGNS